MNARRKRGGRTGRLEFEEVVASDKDDCRKEDEPTCRETRLVGCSLPDPGIVEGSGSAAMSSCTSQDARDRFADAGLTYADVGGAEIEELCDRIAGRYAAALKRDPKAVVPMILDRRGTKATFAPDGALLSASIFVLVYGFERREAVSFNRDGLIGFCDDRVSATLMKPVIEGFCDWVAALEKRKAGDTSGRRPEGSGAQL